MDSTGRIGVGTDSPGNTVHLGAAAGLGLRFENYTSGNSSYLTFETGDLFQSNVGGSGDFGWVAAGGRKMTLSNAGKIGSAIPSAKLDVDGTVNVTGVATFQSNVDIPDDVRLRIGNDQESSNNNTIIQETTGGNLVIKGSNLFLQ